MCIGETKIQNNISDYNINNEFNNNFGTDELSKNGRYPNIKAYIKSFLESSILEYDCDVSGYSMYLCKDAWEFLNDGNIGSQEYCNKNKYKKEIEVNGYIYRGDTLNSLKTPFNHFINFYYKKLGKDDFNMKNSGYRWLSKRFDVAFSEEQLDKVPYSRLILDQFEVFAALSDTIGNQFPCPKYFNGERSNYGKFEFSDLFLTVINEYYIHDGDSKKLEKLFISIEDKEFKVPSSGENRIWTKEQHTIRTLDNCLEWLSKFDGWVNFIEDNYFQDFIVDAKPRELWKDHDFEKLDLPEIGQEFVDYLKFINNGIISRGIRIKEKVVNKIK
jgi:hypothetical protein